MNNELFPNRPLLPKINVYKTNGTGRDVYVAFNNGGFSSKPLEESEAQKLSNRASRPIITSLKLKPLVEHNTYIKHYKSDGTGRDRYITFDEGGFSNPYYVGLINAQSFYRNNLRGYDRPNYVSSSDHFQKAQMRKRRINNLELESMKSQKELNTKLSSPKFFNSPKIRLPRLGESPRMMKSLEDLGNYDIKTDPF